MILLHICHCRRIYETLQWQEPFHISAAFFILSVVLSLGWRHQRATISNNKFSTKTAYVHQATREFEAITRIRFYNSQQCSHCLVKSFRDHKLCKTFPLGSFISLWICRRGYPICINSSFCILKFNSKQKACSHSCIMIFKKLFEEHVKLMKYLRKVYFMKY